MKIDIMIVDDHPVFREGLKTILSKEKGFNILYEAKSGEEAMQLIMAEANPDIIIMDINMPGMDGLETSREIKSIKENMKILVLTMHSDEEYLRVALETGIDGYVLKRAVDTELISAIKVIINDEKYIYPTLAPLLHNGRTDIMEQKVELSNREKEVLSFIALGYTQKEIASELFLSIKTVETYRARIAEKIGASKRSDMVKYAIHNKLIDLK